MVGNISLNDPRFNYQYKGYCSIINQIIDMVVYHTKNHLNYDVIISDDQVLKLFNQIKPINSDITYNVGEQFLSDFFAGRLDTSYNAHTDANIDKLNEKYIALTNTLEIKPEIKMEFDNEFHKLFDNRPYVAVQIRGTDKITEVPEIPIENIYKHVDIILEKSGLNTIYLATDDIKYLNGFITRYGDETVKFNNKNKISTDSNPLHFNQDREKINYEVLSDVYFLSKSEYLCYSYSNVSLLALIMGINNFKIIQNLNIIL